MYVALADAAATLAATEKYYAELPYHSEAFTTTYTSLKQTKPSTWDGTLWGAGGAYAIDLKVEGEHVAEVFDGKRAWFVLHSMTEYWESDASAQAMPASLLAGTSIAACCAVATSKDIVSAIVLTPKTKGPVRTLELVIDPVDSHVSEYILKRSDGAAYDVVLDPPDTRTKPPTGTLDPSQLPGYTKKERPKR